jgi:hypothetical protein
VVGISKGNANLTAPRAVKGIGMAVLAIGGPIAVLLALWQLYNATDSALLQAIFSLGSLATVVLTGIHWLSLLGSGLNSITKHIPRKASAHTVAQQRYRQARVGLVVSVGLGAAVVLSDWALSALITPAVVALGFAVVQGFRGMDASDDEARLRQNASTQAWLESPEARRRAELNRIDYWGKRS